MEKYIVIDLETTGHSPDDGDKIIEIGMVVINNDKITDTYSSFFQPKQSIPPFIAHLTGITNEDVKDAPLFEEEAAQIVRMFKGSYLIAHNVPFDLGFLNKELAQVGFEQLSIPVIDTVELSRILYPQAGSYKLEQLAEYLNITHDQPHRALSDAYVTAHLFLQLKQKVNTLPYETVTHLLRLESALDSDIYHLLLNRQEQLMFAPNEESDIASYRGMAYKDIKIIKREPYELSSSFGEYLDHIYGTSGSMSKYMDNYEERTGQRELSESIFDNFREESHALIEAGTGTGKTLAYLLPALYEAKKLNKRIVISTYTTQLQTQLLEEEIPLVQKLVPFPIATAILKGKRHYLSLDRFEQELRFIENDNYDMILTKAMLLVWITETETGDIDEIQLPTSGYYFYQKISTELEGDPDPSSSWFSRSYYFKAKEKAQQADIIITNHALLSTDMYHDYRSIPAYQKVIIDEAHHFEAMTAKNYGCQLDYVSTQYLLNECHQWYTQFINKEKRFSYSLESWQNCIEEAKFETDDLFRTLFQYVSQQKRHQSSMSDIGRVQYEYHDAVEDPDKWALIKEKANRLILFLHDLISELSYLSFEDEERQNLRTSELENQQEYMKQLQDLIDKIKFLLLTENNGRDVKWIEIEASGAKNAAYIYSEPIDISDVLKQEFFDQKKSVILTSATLTMRGSFTYIKNRLGLLEDVNTYTFESPFNYNEQVQLLVPSDFPTINHDTMDEFIYSTCEAIISLADVTKGRMLVLFTSYDMLRKAYYLLKEILDDNNDLVLIAQGISSGSRSRLKKNFQSFDQSILLGTNSFWEGIDIPGENLSSLVIVRLPFQPPNHPIYEAKANVLKEAGKNPFFELALPSAVIRFKQGFGRLIRSSSDRGIVFVCDVRLMKARYSKFFTASIPKVPIYYETTHELIKRAEKWF